jgi:hypothetical protein
MSRQERVSQAEPPTAQDHDRFGMKHGSAAANERAVDAPEVGELPLVSALPGHAADRGMLTRDGRIIREPQVTGGASDRE